MEEERLMGGERGRRYGACGPRRNEPSAPLLRHTVQPGDTLQGLALKYGSTTEKIRRANRLFASDSLFIKEFLMIPVSKDNILVSPDDILISPDDISPSPPAPTITHRASIAGPPSSSNDFTFGSPDEKKSFDEFLNRVDSSLATIKKDVARTSEKSEFGRYSADLCTRKKPTPRLRQSASVGGVGASPSVTIIDNENSYHGAMGETVVLAQGRHVRSSLQRLQRTQDDWFQL